MHYHFCRSDWLSQYSGIVRQASVERFTAGPSSSITVYTHHFSRRPCPQHSFSTTAMAFLKASLVGVASARFAAARLATRNTPSSVLIARRLLSSSSSSRAQPVDPLRSQTKDYLPDIPVPRSPPLDATFPGEGKDPYHGGPSAIEKAVHLFFFTEIIRGSYTLPSLGHLFMSHRPFRRNYNYYRNVDCLGTVLPTTLYHYVPIRERPSFP